jgi:regulatory protein
VRDRLRERGHASERVQETIERAIHAGLLDDAAFAKLWIRDRVGRHPLSRAAVVQELRAKGVSDPLIAETLEKEYPQAVEGELAQRLVEDRLQRLRGVDPNRRTARVLAHLSRRGFSRGLAVDAVRAGEEALQREEDNAAGRTGI